MKAITVKWKINHDNKTIEQDIKIIDAPSKEEDDLDFFYREIGCRTIDVVQFNGLDIFVDDEGLLVSGNVVIEYYDNGEPIVILAGNLVITNGIDTIGRTVWFSDDDHKTMMNIVKRLESFVVKGITK